MSYKLIITSQAKHEIEEAYFYYETAQLGLGEIFLENLDWFFNKISNSPLEFPQKRAPYREAFIKKFPFLIIFEIGEDSIVVYSVFNTRKNPEKKPGR